MGSLLFQKAGNPAKYSYADSKKTISIKDEKGINKGESQQKDGTAKISWQNWTGTGDIRGGS